MINSCIWMRKTCYCTYERSVEEAGGASSRWYCCTVTVFWLKDWVCVSGAESLACPHRSHHPGTNWTMLPLEEVISFALSYSSIVQQPWTAARCISQAKTTQSTVFFSAFTSSPFSQCLTARRWPFRAPVALTPCPTLSCSAWRPS